MPKRQHRHRKRSGSGLRQDLADVLNRHSREAASGTSDFVLARFLVNCLEAFERAVAARDEQHSGVAQPPIAFPVAVPPITPTVVTWQMPSVQAHTFEAAYSEPQDGDDGRAMPRSLGLGQGPGDLSERGL